MNYIPLNVKTHYELLSSLIKLEDLVSLCKENSINAIGITDTNMFGTMEFINLCKKNDIKYIIGVHFKVNNLDMILYALNYNGYVNLLNLVSIRNTKELRIEDIKKHKNDLICVTSDYENYFNYKEIYELVYLAYQTKEQKTNALILTDKVVYIKEGLYLNSEDKEYLMYLNMIRDGKTIDDKEKYNFDNHINYDIDEFDASTTKNFADLINIEMPEFHFKLPEYSSNKVELLETLCNKGLNKRLNNDVDEIYKKRLNEELKVINDMNFTDYFLIVYDFILYAKKNKIVVGPGRGSAAGSLVSYSLGITEIDPIKYDLIFERFLNKDRITLPDIDTDIEYLRRDEVVEYVKNKYGRDKVANIITFGTLLPKQVLRDVGRVLNIPVYKIDALTKTIKTESEFSLIENNLQFKKIISSDIEFQTLLRISKKLEGLKRHTSVHAAGVIISDEPLMNKVPLYSNGNELLTGYTMEHLESIGLLKMDFLALKNLTIIDTIVKKISEERKIYIDINKVPLNDKKTLDIFYNVDTTGIFQFESEGMKSFLKSLKVQSFNDLIAAIALYRPGPRENIPEFIKIREGKGKVNYIVPELESILNDTNGIIVYQEQIMEILKRIGSFSYSEADNIRRAMSKKKEDIILKYKEAFINGSIKNGYTKEQATEIYDLVLKFANYGFNKSHSVAYSMVAYQMAFLKAHFPEYFMTTLLDMVIGNEYKTKEYMTEAKRYDLEFMPANINKSIEVYVVNNNKITLPLTAIKNLGKEAVNAILIEREKGMFKDYQDFIKRCYSSKVNIKSIENLIYAGALDGFNLNKRTMIENLESNIEYAKLIKELDENLIEKPMITIYSEYDTKELTELETKMYGFFIQNHPVSRFKKDNICPLNKIESYFDKVIVTLAMIENIKEIQTKNKEKMAFITISDETKTRTLIMFPNAYNDNFGIKKGDILEINAKVEKRMSEYQLIAMSVKKV